jgi:clan AA aspartic protease
MGLVYANIEMINVEDIALHRRGYLPADRVRRMTTRMMVDSGAIMLAINEQIQTQLELPFMYSRAAQLANGSIVELDVVGPLEVRFGDRTSTVNALVLPGNTEPLFGAIPMEEMDLIVDPAQQALTPHPDRPLRPVVSLK